MCGFAGIVSWNQRCPVTRAMLAAMADGVAHRGPDARGTWIRREGAGAPDHPAIGLAHCRLAILDLDRRADQPMVHPNGCRIVYNGEIYNYRELRRDLSRAAPDYVWRTTGDTEVLLQAYAVWGAKCLEYLNGMFAFALWDPRAGQLLLARDRMGQKPLYWASFALGDDERDLPDAGSAIAFASEIASLAAVPWIARDLSRPALARYLAWGYIAAPLTIWRGARKLPRSTALSVAPAGAKLERFYAQGTPPDDPDPVAATRQLVLRAVRRQMISDVPIGCFLSGGIDSSIVALAMTRAAGRARDVRTFSIGFDDPRYDESPCARRVAEHLGTAHHALTVKPDAGKDLPELARIFGEPFGDSSALPTLYLARFTRGHLKVALSGDGGDELFAGYDRYRAMLAGRLLRWAPAPARRLLGYALGSILPGGGAKSRRAKLRRFLASLHRSPAERYGSYMQLLDAAELGRLMPDEYDSIESNAAWLPERFAQNAAGRDDVQTAMATDRATYLPEDLFTKVDRTAMRFALEVRSPLMDPDVVDFAGTLPTRLQTSRRQGKLPLRAAFAQDLPAEVWDRPKMGFAIPIDRWLREELRAPMRDALLARDAFVGTVLSPPAIERLIHLHERGIDQGQRLFALLMLEWWGKNRYSTSVTPPAPPSPVPSA